MSLPTTAPAGYYGIRGWTTKKNIRDILRRHLTMAIFDDEDADPNVLGSYEPFQGLGAVGAQRLLGTLPIRNLADRQNYAPTCEALLRAAIENPGRVELVGYAIGPERADERVTIEGFVYYGHSDYNVADYHDENCECTQLWERLRDELKLSSALDRPDEIRRLRPSWNPTNEGWWLWWD